jgi:hypothetical protein
LSPTSLFGRVAILWRGDQEERRSATPENSRFKAVFAALADLRVDAQAVVYDDDVAETVRAKLTTVDGVLVWVNPIHEGRNRAKLDALLREVATRGTWVSAHPDVIPQDGHQRGPSPHPRDALGLRYGALSNAGSYARRVAAAASRRSARHQAQSW